VPTIYALSDPRTDEIRYVGIALDIHKRYAQHISHVPSGNEKKDDWISRLKDAGLLPRLQVLEAEVSKKIIFDREVYWIQHYLAQGEKLTNILYGDAISVGQEGELLTLQQAAKKTGKSEKTLRRWILAGKLRASKSGDRYLLNPDDLEVFYPQDSIEWQLREQIADLQERLSKVEATLAILTKTA
jgi:excisionase family DNA binding protein